MLRKTALFIVLLLSIPLISEAWFITSTVTLSTSHLYPDDFGGQTLQEAIWNDTVKNGDIIVVRSGTYYEHLWVNKSITLEGFDRHTTFLDGSGNGSVIMLGADNVKIFEFTIQHGERYGVYFGVTSDCNVSRNIVVNNEIGVELSSSSYCTLKDNDIRNNTYNFGVHGSALEHYIHDIDDSNTVDEKPIYYLVNQHGTPIPSDAGYVAVIHSSNILVENLQLGSNLQGVLIAYSTDITVENMVFEGNYETVVTVENSMSITVRDFELSYPLTDYEDGIYFWNTTNSVIENVTLSHHLTTRIPISLWDSKNNLITNNKLTTKTLTTTGIELYYSDHNRIFDNVITKSTDEAGYMLGVYLSNSHSNVIVGNTICTYSVGIARYTMILDSSNETVIYHNNFLDDENRIWSEYSNNTEWDNGLEGNYWKDYDGEDDDCDGIGDTPHLFTMVNQTISHYGTDNYPLMNPWKSQRIFEPEEPWYDYIEAEGGLGRTLSTFSNSTVACLSFNRRLKQISLKVTSAYSGFLNITIPRNWLDSPFTVSVDKLEVGYLYGPHPNYSSLYITYGPGTHTIEINGTEIWGIRGDLNGDGVVDIADVVVVTGNYRTKEEEVPEQYDLKEADTQG